MVCQLVSNVILPTANIIYFDKLDMNKLLKHNLKPLPEAENSSFDCSNNLRKFLLVTFKNKPQ